MGGKEAHRGGSPGLVLPPRPPFDPIAHHPCDQKSLDHDHRHVAYLPLSFLFFFPGDDLKSTIPPIPLARQLPFFLDILQPSSCVTFIHVMLTYMYLIAPSLPRLPCHSVVGVVCFDH